jgi:vancomycin permeability regulator SanA
MANNLPPVWRFDFGDYLPLGSDFQKFLANANLFTLAVYNALNKGLGFANLQRSLYSTTVLAASTTPLSFVNPLAIAPSGLAVVQVLQTGKVNTALANAVSAANWYYDGKNINVLNISGLTSGQNYQIVLEVM